MSDSDENMIPVGFRCPPALKRAVKDFEERCDEALAVKVSNAAAYRMLIESGLKAHGYERDGSDGEWQYTRENGNLAADFVRGGDNE